MVYTISLYASLAIFCFGLLYRVANWFRYRVDQEAETISTSQRVTAAITGLASTLFSIQILVLLRIFLLDVIFQKYFMKMGALRWFAHMCIYLGFILLLLMHALDKIITNSVFEVYYSTLNPFLFLRNLFGFVILLGLGIALYRRLFSPQPQPKSTVVDYSAIAVLGVIMISGVLLEATKITSHTLYQEMVSDYSGLDEADTDSLSALNAYWVENYGLASPGVKRPFDADTLQTGEELHKGSCMECHSPPQWAFMSYGVSRVLRPAALYLDRSNVHTGLWYIHFLACFLGLAYLPFSKFFHMFSTPIHLFIKGITIHGKSKPANLATFQAIELDACVHCGECTRRCSVAVALNEIPNPNILPSEKHAAFRSLLSGRYISKRNLLRIQEGCHICTECRRCTDVCPVGINLEGLWFNLKRHAANLGYPKPEAWARNTIGSDFIITKFNEERLPLSFDDKTFEKEITGHTQVNTFSLCFGCQNCTNACPVVNSHESPRKALGMLPHEIMHCLALRQKELALGSMMLWDCLTCYLCQEQCPQGVCITDILYQLKNLALKRMKQEA